MTTELQPWAFRIVRYAPNLARDEWMNLGVLFYSAKENRLEARLLRNESEFARIRRLHPAADIPLLRNLETELGARLDGFEGDAAGQVDKLDDVLSNVIQLGPQRAVLTASPAEELERIYEEYVSPPRSNQLRVADEGIDSPAVIRRRAREIFSRAGLAPHLRPARAADFTGAGDTMRLDFHYRRNGTQGFAQALSLSRDPAQAKAFAFTAERIRQRLAHPQLTAITESEPQPGSERHLFVSEILREQQIEIVPLPALADWAARLASALN